MEFVDYAKITIQVMACESDINGSNELQLSDAVYALENALRDWLKKQATDKFKFKIWAS